MIHDGSASAPDMDWDAVMGGGPESGTRSANGDDALSPIDFLSREALDALRDDHQQRSKGTCRHMSVDNPQHLLKALRG